MQAQAFDRTGPYIRIMVEIVKAIKWFIFIMLISIVATWNAFTLLLMRECTEPDAEATCESPRDASAVFSTLFDMVNMLLFGNPNLQSLERTKYFGLVVFIFIVSMIAMPIVLLNMFIAIMGHSYDKFQVRFSDAQCCMTTPGIFFTALHLVVANLLLMPLQERSDKESFRLKANIILVRFWWARICWNFVSRRLFIF